MLICEAQSSESKWCDIVRSKSAVPFYAFVFIYSMRLTIIYICFELDAVPSLIDIYHLKK